MEFHDFIRGCAGYGEGVADEQAARFHAGASQFPKLGHGGGGEVGVDHVRPGQVCTPEAAQIDPGASQETQTSDEPVEGGRLHAFQAGVGT